jgi:LysR family transcriptional regulator, benzoate and cis,cis-muconate-responsive activator of ben and cat genes
VELRHLRYFVAVAETENVSRAALKLHVSQPALSRQIRDLEDEIGFSLLERTAKSVRLTDAGRAFLDNARALLQNADEAIAKARAIASVEPSELHVGYSAENTVEMLPKTLRTFQQARPNVHVRLHDWNNKDIVDGIRDGRLQLGLIVPPVRASALHDLRYEELFHVRVCVVVAPQHPFAGRGAIPIAEVAAEPLIGLTREDYPGYYDYVAMIFSKVKQKPRVVEEYDSYNGIMSAVEAGTGVALGGDVFRNSLGNRLKFLHLTPEPKPVAVGIVGTKSRLSPAAEKFWQCAKEVASKK